MPRKSRGEGFTIIEVLIVITIIGILAALLLPSLFTAKIAAKEQATRSLISNLGLELTNYNSHWGKYPPSKLDKPAMPNDLNVGIEAMTACLFSQRSNPRQRRSAPAGPYLDPGGMAKYLGNADGDSALQNPTKWILSGLELRELKDEFGTPLVYFNYWTDYKDKKVAQKVQLRKGAEPIEIEPFDPSFAGFRTYQLFSVGVNGKFEQGKGDDIGNWTK